MSNLDFQYINLSPSRYLQLYITGLHALVSLALLYSLAAIWPDSWWPVFILPIALLVIVAVIVYTTRVLNTHCNQQTADFISGLSCANQQWRLHTELAEVPVILQQATVWSWLIVLHCYGEVSKQHYAVVIATDSVSAEQHRRLRVLLRHIVSW